MQSATKKPYFYSLMNMTGTHDTIRLITLLGEAEHPKGKTQMFLREYLLPEIKRSIALRRLKLFFMIMLSHPGMPCIYYGDEIGMEGFADPFNRGTYPWGNEDKSLIDSISYFAKLRLKTPILTRGEYHPMAVGEGGYLSKRELDGRVVFTLINRDMNEKTFAFKLTDKAIGIIDMLSGQKTYIDDNKSVRIGLQGLSGAWLKEIYDK